MIKSVLDTGRRFCSVCYCDHYRRNNSAGLLPCLIQDLPVLSQQVVRLSQQIRQRFFRWSRTVNIVPYRIVCIDVIQLGPKALCIRRSIIPHDNTGRLDQAGLNAVIQAKVTDDPSEQGFLIVSLTGGGKGSG